MTRFDIVVTRQGARFLNRRFPCAIGQAGITVRKREGDRATPAGTHRITGMLYRADRLARPADWALPIGPNDLWSDAADDIDYNHPVRMPYPYSAERLHRPDRLYDLVLLTDWNWPQAQPDHGSAIFVHAWRSPRFPTAGCVAFARADLAWIAPRIRHQTRLIVRI